MSRLPNDVDRSCADRSRVALDVAGDRNDAFAELADERLHARKLPLRMNHERRARLVETPRDPGTDIAARSRDDRSAAA